MNKNNNECKEFNNLKYRTMINTGTNLENNIDTSEDTIKKLQVYYINLNFIKDQ